jgi:hypothetical protein
MNRWEYLVSKEFQLRQYICEYYLDDVDYVFDIGAYKKTFSREGVIALDPLKTMPDSFHGTLSEWCLGNDIPNNFAVVVMGLHIEGDDVEMQTLINLIKKANVVLIEYPINHKPSVDQFDRILEECNLKSNTIVDLTFPDPQTEGYVPYLNRRLTVLERK